MPPKVVNRHTHVPLALPLSYAQHFAPMTEEDTFDANAMTLTYAGRVSGDTVTLNMGPPSPDGVTAERPAFSCHSIMADHPESLSGLYYLQRPDGLGAFTAYCDMETDGGGWMAVSIVANDNDDSSGPDYFTATIPGSGGTETMPTYIGKPGSGMHIGPDLTTRKMLWETGGSGSEFRGTAYRGGKIMLDVKMPAQETSTANSPSNSFACSATGCGGNGSPTSGFSNTIMPGKAVLLADVSPAGLTAGQNVCLGQVGNMFCNCWEYVGAAPMSSSTGGSDVCDGSQSIPTDNSIITTKLFGDYCTANGVNANTCGEFTVFWQRLA